MFSRSSSKKSIYLALLLLLLAAAAGFVWLKVATPAAPAWLVAGNGRIESTSYDVATRLSGRLIALEPKEGDLVGQGAEARANARG